MMVIQDLPSPLQDPISPPSGSPLPAGLPPETSPGYTPAPSVQASDHLEQATEAIDRAIAETAQNPHMRLQAIATIKEAYLKARFGA